MDQIKELPVFISYNPLDADEFVWVDTDIDKLEALLVQKASLFKADKVVYLVNKTQELDLLYHSLSKADFKNLDFRRLKQFNYWNCGVPGISMIAGWRGTKGGS